MSSFRVKRPGEPCGSLSSQCSLLRPSEILFAVNAGILFFVMFVYMAEIMMHVCFL